MLDVPQMLTRIPRLKSLARGLGKELSLWKGGSEPLTPDECSEYLTGLLDAIQGLDKGALTLERAVVRLVKDFRV
jgi:hypothetical protein